MLKCLSPLLLLVIMQAGCASQSRPPVIDSRALLGPNVGQRVTIIGKAEFNRVWGPSVVQSEFELPLVGLKTFQAEDRGKAVEVIGVLNSRSHFEKPPMRDLGEYWLTDATYQFLTKQE